MSTEITESAEGGKTEFDAPLEFQGNTYFRMAKGIIFVTEEGDIPSVISVSEDAKNYFRELDEFKERLDRDVSDYHNVLTEKERGVIKRSLLAIS